MVINMAKEISEKEKAVMLDRYLLTKLEAVAEWLKFSHAQIENEIKKIKDKNL